MLSKTVPLVRTAVKTVVPDESEPFIATNGDLAQAFDRPEHTVAPTKNPLQKLVNTVKLWGSLLGKAKLGTGDSYGGLVSDARYPVGDDAFVPLIWAKPKNFTEPLGYPNFIDSLAANKAVNLDCEPIRFQFDGKDYKIELWKGKYGDATGGEIGVYTGPVKVFGHPVGAEKDDAAATNDMLEMSYRLLDGDHPLWERKGETWWLNGYSPGTHIPKTNLKIQATLRFSKPGMSDEFMAALEKLGYRDVEVSPDGDIVSFLFDRPKTEQP